MDGLVNGSGYRRTHVRAPAMAAARGRAHFCGSVWSWSSCSCLRAEQTAASGRREHGRAGTSGRSPTAGLNVDTVRVCMTAMCWYLGVDN